MNCTARKTTIKLLFRNATQDDWPSILQLHNEQQQAQGTSYELPYLFGRNIPVALVGVDQDGIVHQCFYVESVAELRFVGCDPRATALSQREADGLCYVLRLMGFRYLECFVPRKLKKFIGKPLKRAGFEDKDSELSYFSRDLRDKPYEQRPEQRGIRDRHGKQ